MGQMGQISHTGHTDQYDLFDLYDFFDMQNRAEHKKLLHGTALERAYPEITSAKLD